jgi:hypothetical protein
MFFDTLNEIPNLIRIQSRLKKRGLEMDEDGEWEKHGPHEGMNYMVILGPCRWITGPGKGVINNIVIYPNRIYEDDGCGWSNVGKNQVIKVPHHRVT